MALACFKAYDIRGKVPSELNEIIAYQLGLVFAKYYDTKTVVVGMDVRLSSQPLFDALVKGLTETGTNVIDIGLCGTEEVYFQTAHLNACGGIMITASHNPMDYNGMKLVHRNAVPISQDTGLLHLSAMIENEDFPTTAFVTGKVTQHYDKKDYIQHLLQYIEPTALRPLKIVTNAGNGGAGQIIDLLRPHLPCEFITINHEPDGRFPNGIPNPMLPERRSDTAQAVVHHQADFGIAWDGDFDRCFFFDANGRFIEGYYLVGLLAQTLLATEPSQSIVIDPRVIWNTEELVKQANGQCIYSKGGHAFIKQVMREHNALYGGEMSAHHYFRDFYFCDSGMIPWLLIADLLSRSEKTLAELVDARIQAFPCSGEINFTVKNSQATMEHLENYFAQQEPKVIIDRLDGLSLNFQQWRFNVRASNTEPLLRLNIETRADTALLQEKINLLKTLILNSNA